MIFTVVTEEARTRCSLLDRSGILVAVILLFMSSACTPLFRDSISLSPGTRPQPGEAPLVEAGTPEGKAQASLPAEASLIDKIDLSTPPRQAVSLRWTEDGRKLIESGHNSKALTHLEKTLAIDSNNPYVYFFLAKAHFNLAHYRQSVDFLDVAEALLDSQPYWIAEVLSLKGENFQAMGLLKEANHSYAESLRLNPKNHKAAVELHRVQRAMEIPSVR